MILVIVESPSKSRTIGKYLGKGYTVVASMGHIRDLPKSKLGVDVENDYKEEYEVPASKKKVISELKKLAKGAEAIYLATDEDREGEAISWHIAEVLKELPKSKLKAQMSKEVLEERAAGPAGTPPASAYADKCAGRSAPATRKAASLGSDTPVFRRVAFHEITKEAVLKAFEEPREVDLNLVDAQRARRILDRLVGYKLSPLLWKKVRYGLSAGRVQSVAVRFVVEREKEIRNFKGERYFEVEVILKRNDAEILAKLTKINNKSIYVPKKYALFSGDYKTNKTILDKEDILDRTVEDLRRAQYKVLDVSKKELQRQPKPPFTTSSMQQDASTRLGFSPKVTMVIAQKLYEQGLITYMRTDSTNLSSQVLDAVRGYISKNYSGNLPESPRIYKTKVKVAQEAHEAIRPTNVSYDPLSPIINKLKPNEKRLYELIWRRAVASQMKSAMYDTINVKIDADGAYLLEISDTMIKFLGFLEVYNGDRDVSKSHNVDVNSLNVGDVLSYMALHTIERQTTPPPSYNEASLIKELEKFGIGRPSTYAPTMTIIQSRGYIQNAGGRLKPTDVAFVVNDLLVGNFEQIVDVNFTAGLESELDAIANGDKKLVPVIRDFYIPFEENLEGKQNSLNRSDYTVIESLEEKCPDCGAYLVVKLGRYGKFVSCSNFPKCKYLRPIIEATGLKCPKCKDGDVVVRRTKRGKVFYGCSNYPKCDFAVWKLEEVKEYVKDS